MIHEYTLKTANNQRQVVDKAGQPVRYMRYVFAEAVKKQSRTSLFIHAQHGPEPLTDDVDLIICDAGINWDVSLAPLPTEAPPPPKKAPSPAEAHPQKPAPSVTPPAANVEVPPTPPASADVPAMQTEPAAPAPAKRPVEVPCPSCKAGPGLLCTTKDGKVTAFHKARVTAFKEATEPSADAAR